MKTFKVTIARILTNYPAKVFTVQAQDIISAQIRVWRKVHHWHYVIAAELHADGDYCDCQEYMNKPHTTALVCAFCGKPPRM